MDAAIVWSVVSTVVAVFGIIATVYFYLKSRKRRRLTYAVSGTVLSTPEIPEFRDLELRYRGEVVPRVAVSDIILWNSGTDTVAGSDVACRSPIRLLVPDGQRVLSCAVVAGTRNEIGARVSVEPEVGFGYVVAFDFLDPGDGMRLKVVHTGGASDAVEVRGTVLGAGSVVKTRRRVDVDWVFGPAVFVSAIALMGPTRLLSGWLEKAFPLRPTWTDFGLMAVFCAAVLGGVVAIHSWVQRVWMGPRPPASLT
jgi:hypothetical protein